MRRESAPERREIIADVGELDIVVVAMSSATSWRRSSSTVHRMRDDWMRQDGGSRM
jgi:hypothetical protein